MNTIEIANQTQKIRQQPVTIQNVELHQERGAKVQEEINQLANPSLELLAQVAEARVGAQIYPQYAGYFNGWEMVTIRRDIKTKAGVAFKAGDTTICQPPTDSSRSVFSYRNGITTQLSAGCVQASSLI